MDFTYFHEEHEIIERFLMTTIFCHCEMMDTPKLAGWSVLANPSDAGMYKLFVGVRTLTR